MKKLIAFIAIILILYSCNTSDRGELVGTIGKQWNPEKPFGMTLIPGGAFIMGKSDDDFVAVNDAPTKTVTVRSFYMDETEITNAEYRQFVYWVRDSTVRLKLAILADEVGATPGDEGIGEFAFVDQENEEMSPYDQYMYDNYFGMGDDFYAGRKINNNLDIQWDTANYPDEYYAEVMDTMYIPSEEAYNGQRTIDVTKLNFQYTYMDMQAAARDDSKRRKDFIIKEDINIYPDTTVWIKDYNYSYNEPMHNDYFWHQAYGDYPVVGVSWKQAKAFSVWRTLYKNSYQKSRRRQQIIDLDYLVKLNGNMLPVVVYSLLHILGVVLIRKMIVDALEPTLSHYVEIMQLTKHYIQWKLNRMKLTVMAFIICQGMYLNG